MKQALLDFCRRAKRRWKQRQIELALSGVDGAFRNRFLAPDRLLSARVARIRLSKLRAHVYTPQGDQFLPLDSTPVALYLRGSTGWYENYHLLENDFDRHSARQLDDLVQSIKTHGYSRASRLVVFEGENIIRDGQHRAAVLQFLFGDIPVDVVYVRLANR